MTGEQLQRLRTQAETSTYSPHGEVADADCVIGFSFGYIESKAGVEPGTSNEQLAAYIEKSLPNLPLILQFEIADALHVRNPAHVIRESRVKGEYLHSREIAEQALLFMKAQGWQKAVIITHQAMLARNDALCQKLGMHTILPSGLHIDYDVRSAQPWTRDPAAWWARECTVIDTCLEVGWL